LYFTRINWTPAGAGVPALADVQGGRGDAFVKGIFPVNDGDANLYRQGLFPTLNYSEDPDHNNVIEGTEGDDLLALLASCRQLIVNAGLGANNRTFLYGWIAGNPISGNGLSNAPGFNAFGNADPTRYQRTYAHELTHNFGGVHNTRSLDEVGWDVGGRLSANPAGNNTSGRVKPTTLFDIMNAGRLTNQAWIDTQTYNLLLSNSSIGSPDAADKPVDRVLVVQGVFDPSGTKLLRLKPVFRYPWASQPTSRRQKGRFVAQATDAAGNTSSARFDALVTEDSEKGGSRNGFFEVMVAVPPESEVASLRIADATGRTEFASLKRTTPPQVRVVSPAAGAKLGERTEVVWDVQDTTPPGQRLFQVAYSPDGGRSFVPVAVDVPGSQRSVTFDSTQIQKSQNGLIRVFVSNGLNTAFADVGKLTTP
jgi:hypothetical protein